MNAKSIVRTALKQLLGPEFYVDDYALNRGVSYKAKPVTSYVPEAPITYAGEYSYKNSIIGYLDGEKLPMLERVTIGKWEENDAAIAALVEAPIGATYVTVTSEFKFEPHNGWYSVYVKETEESWSLLFLGTLI